MGADRDALLCGYEGKIRHSEAQLRSILLTAPDIIMTVDRAGTIIIHRSHAAAAAARRRPFGADRVESHVRSGAALREINQERLTRRSTCSRTSSDRGRSTRSSASAPWRGPTATRGHGAPGFATAKWGEKWGRGFRQPAQRGHRDEVQHSSTPNGIELSLDENTLYVGDVGNGIRQHRPQDDVRHLALGAQVRDAGRPGPSGLKTED